jgi:hypothetical protein
MRAFAALRRAEVPGVRLLLWSVLQGLHAYPDGGCTACPGAAPAAGEGTRQLTLLQ